MAKAIAGLRAAWIYAPIVPVALIGVLVTWLVYAKVTDLEQQRLLSAFSEAARDRILVVQRELAYALGVVQDIGSFFDASRQVTRRQFREFVGPALRRNPGADSLQWVPRVTAEEAGGFLVNARRGFARFEMQEVDAKGALVPASPRPVHFPILYVQPYARNKDLLGLDLAADPDLLARLDEAARDRSLRVTDPAPLPGEGADAYGFTVYLPVGERAEEGEPPQGGDGEEAEVGSSPAGLRGFAIGVFRVGDLVEHALANLGAAGVDLRFFSGRPSVTSAPFYVHSSRARPGTTFGAGDESELIGRPAYVDEMPVGDRSWTVVCNPVEGFFESEHWSGQVIFAGGMAFTLLACVYLFAMLGRAQDVRRLVAQRTLELEDANAALNKEVTERRRAEHALQLLNVTLEGRVARRAAEAERRARDLEQFAYVTSHDLKAPLRGIANLATWLKDDLNDKLTAETAEQIDLLRDRVARMNALVEGLLAYSRVGRTQGSVEEVDTAALVADTIDSLAPPPGFRVEVAPDMPRLSTDRLQLGQVFANLIGNAITHHDRDTGVVRVSGRELDERCEFEVSDDGPGIPPEYHDKVFMMFQTLAVKDFGSNTGIGLALVKKLVEEHGGTIRLTSAEGRGTSFTFTWLQTERERES
jgi:signal transduction histidine kinase